MEVRAKDKSDALHALVQSVQMGQVKRIRQSLESLLTITALEIDPVQVRILQSFANSIKLDSEMLSTGQVAKKLGVSTQAVINWIEAGRLEAIKLPGGHYRIPADQFRTTIEQDTKREVIFEQLWTKREGLPPIDEDDLEDL
ncbi:MerR family transcriptional regulator [Desulfosporosinus lacus]|uniref:DNA binding domain-containing protein, excisionase family n=1 Tax=Desulfosporosinus lacus DSM 15449 TaxID=1121420 RepID=A0A1M5VM00_9FIRM|nr:helix-turn-helix domain-containing protein [Desulfosporosinus lacus]SHH76269.1 DNA binding domain-containing protein, excisionase family [Desulfosporosinus lacus DSM 15449]